MLLLSYGITKSGSTLAFELAKAVMALAGHEQVRLEDGIVEPGHHINFVNRLDRARIDTMLAAVPANRMIAIKTHTRFSPDLMPELDALVSEGHIRIHAVYRDPREICLSLLDAGIFARSRDRKAFSEIETLEQAAENVSRQIETFRRWGAVQGARCLAYNDMAFDMENSIVQMADEFAVPADPSEVRRVVEGSAFTQKNKAVKDRYRDELTPEEDAILQDRFRDFLDNVMLARNDDWFEAGRARLMGPLNPQSSMG